MLQNHPPTTYLVLIPRILLHPSLLPSSPLPTKNPEHPLRLPSLFQNYLRVLAPPPLGTRPSCQPQLTAFFFLTLALHRPSLDLLLVRPLSPVVSWRSVESQRECLAKVPRYVEGTDRQVQDWTLGDVKSGGKMMRMKTFTLMLLFFGMLDAVVVLMAAVYILFPPSSGPGG
ncbi:hypothetical protein QBC32DRAFT_353305 [Pseudoneurospora amorphoporcata]|uniref:Uncharacterized protein n=1 Tax=Pseudoneurospora amorphoporcata TaxID=241081 RepID=A0AAN6SB69_9PEZI|nr:hypothetical protein QBC32DRAFT_353305 [Pseudoneurospora amorphoporcata]